MRELFALLSDLSTGIFLMLITVVMPLRAWQRWRRKLPSTHVFAYLFETALLIAVLLFTLRKEGIALATVGLVRVPMWAFALHVLIGISVILAPDVVALLVRPVTSMTSVESGHMARLDAIPRGRAVIAFVPVCIIGAFWEELCFRGTALHFAPPGAVGTSIVVFASSFIFGLHHLRFGPMSVLFTTVFGITLCVLYLATRDLLSVMASHGLANLAIAIYFAPKARQQTQTARLFS
jgi:membrane protease YdiL (CAAX protease family)